MGSLRAAGWREVTTRSVWFLTRFLPRTDDRDLGGKPLSAPLGVRGEECGLGQGALQGEESAQRDVYVQRPGQGALQR